MSKSSNRALIPLTNEHFAAFCEKMVGQPYWMGTCLYKCTSSLLSRKTAQYPSHYGSSRTVQYKRDVAAKKVAADCIGAAKGYAWTNGGQGVLEAIGTGKPFTSKYGSNGCPDKGANAMFTYAKSKGMDWGAISTLPDMAGLAVHKSGHVGYTIGGGYAVEWRGFAYGCVKTKIAGRGWTHWYKLPFIQYGETPASRPDEPTPIAVRNLSIKKPMQTGDDVRQLQERLNALGFACGAADGIFGKKTGAAVRAFQAANQLEVDGIVGPKTRMALESLVKQDGTPGVEAKPEQDEYAQGSETAGTSSQTPVSIHVRMTRSENIAVYGSGEVTMDLEEYLRGVVPSEMYESAPIEALKAQAVASRTYAYRRHGSVITDGSGHQAFKASKIGKCPHSDAAIMATKGMILTYGGKVIDCFFCASNKGQTKRSGDVWSTHYPYYVDKPDEWDEAAREEANVTRFGHGVGMSQQGAMWAARHGVSCEAILAFYYVGCAAVIKYE